jgi:hypothetical protein
VIQEKRDAELAEAEKIQAYVNAKSHYDYLTNKIEEFTNRLQYFDEDQEAADDEPKLPPCEPALLYELDGTLIPQISQEAVNIINAIAAGILIPELFDPS